MEETFENPFKETIKTNVEDDNIFNEWIEEDDKRKQLGNTPMSLDTFMKEFPAYKDLYDDMKYHYTVPHTCKGWMRCVELTKQRNERHKEGISDIEYYSMFNSISKDAAKLFAKYLNERKSQSSVNAVADKDIQDYTIEVIRNTLDDCVGVSYLVDREAFIEICKLKKDELEAKRLEIFKDVKPKVVEHFENIGFTLSERNLNSINWWINNFKVKY